MSKNDASWQLARYGAWWHYLYTLHQAQLSVCPATPAQASLWTFVNSRRHLYLNALFNGPTDHGHDVWMLTPLNRKALRVWPGLHLRVRSQVAVVWLALSQTVLHSFIVTPHPCHTGYTGLCA